MQFIGFQVSISKNFNVANGYIVETVSPSTNQPCKKLHYNNITSLLLGPDIIQQVLTPFNE